MTEQEKKVFEAYQLLENRQAGGKNFNLDDKETVEFFTEHGMILREGMFTFLDAKESYGTGEIWFIDESSCDSSLISVKASQPNGSLQRTRGLTNRRFIITPESTGKCQFRIYKARPWELNQGKFSDEISFELWLVGETE